MKVIIHDLGAEYDEKLNQYCDEIIYANGKYGFCQGCFNCWTKHPAECFMKDSLQYIGRIIGKADELIIISMNCYGAYSPAVKNVLDRSNGDSTPLSTYRGKQMHHTLRYHKHKILRVYTYGDITEAERKTFSFMVERNAINFGFVSSEFKVLETVAELESVMV